MPTLCSKCQASINQQNDSTVPGCIFDERCGPCTTLASLDAKILETEDLLEKLKRQRNVTLTEMNQVHDPLIQQVPPEIASHIFALHIYGDDTDIAEYPRPLVLASVCKKWHEIAFSTPQIWTTLGVYSRGNTWDFPAHLAEQWLERSGQLPVDITILWEDPPKEPVVSPMEAVIKVICSHSSRWNTLDLTVPRAAFCLFKADSAVHPHLEILRIHCTYPPPATLTPFHPHNIILHPKEVELYCIPPSLILMNWETVIDLCMRESTLTEVLYVLRLCHRIKEFYTTVKWKNESTTLTPPITLRYLENFVSFWSHFPPLFFDLLTLPALRKFGHIVIHEPAEMVSLTSMFKRSACLLSELNLSWTRMRSPDEDDLINLLYDLPSLRKVSLGFLGSCEARGLFFEHLLIGCASPSGTSGGISRPFLPCLEAFCYDGPKCFSWYILATIYHTHSRSLSTVQFDQSIQQPLVHHPLRPLQFIRIKTPDQKRRKHLLDRESLLLFLDLPKNSMKVQLNRKLMKVSIKRHHLTLSKDVSAFYRLHSSSPLGDWCIGS